MPDHPPPVVDGISMSASLLCLVHCLAAPLLAMSVPALGLIVTHSQLFHASLLAFAVPVGLWALGRGRDRAGLTPLLTGLVGFGLMGAALLLPELAERWLTIAGVSLVGLAHFRNWRAGRAYPTSAPSSIL